jgi:uncharacterized protein YcbK (DUF882 family)
MSWSRRHVLSGGAALAGLAAGLLTHPARSAGPGRASPPASKHISLTNLHTHERVAVEFYRDGTYVPEAMTAIEVLLRDFRTGERHGIDPRLMDYLSEVAHACGVDPEFSVISGYRSPHTNASLREKSAGVAQHSLHMQGRAIDVRMASIDCASLAAHALNLKSGGVGYYRASDFVHLDTGKFRTWKG